MRTAAAALVGVCAITLPLGQATAQERYQLERTENGYVRMDTQTGAISLCRESADELVCQVAAEEQQAYDTEIKELRNKVTALEERVQALEGGEPRVGETLEQEFEQTMTLMERFFRRFMEIVQGIEQDRERQQDQETAPAERT